MAQRSFRLCKAFVAHWQINRNNLNISESTPVFRSLMMHFPANPGGFLRSLFATRTNTSSFIFFLETSHSKPSYLEKNSLTLSVYCTLSIQQSVSSVPFNFLYWADVTAWNPLWKGHFMFFFLRENLTAPVKQKKFQHLSSSLSCTTFCKSPVHTA